MKSDKGHTRGGGGLPKERSVKMSKGKKKGHKLKEKNELTKRLNVRANVSFFS